MHARTTGPAAIDDSLLGGINQRRALMRLLPPAAFSIALAFFSTSARATVYTWDADANPTNGATDGSGVWDLSGHNWFNAGTDIAWTGSSADVANFGPGAGGSGGTVTLGTTLAPAESASPPVTPATSPSRQAAALR